MSIRYSLAMLGALLMAQPVFADEMTANNKSCEIIVKSCLDAGYTRDGADGKQFWMDCMKPLIMGKSVSGVTIDKKHVKACRSAKIKELKHELSEMQKAK